MTMNRQKEIQNGRPYPLGVFMGEDGIFCSVNANEKVEGILLYNGKKELIGKHPFPEDGKFGAIQTMQIKGYKNKTLLYQLYSGDEIIRDPYCREVVGAFEYGKRSAAKEIYGRISKEEFDWENTANPRIPYEDSIFYCMHVRGFTMHASSGVKGKGTFSGIIEKIPYLKELGITTIELMPSYQFEERESKEKGGRLNYWGYKAGNYFSPKFLYCASKSPINEFKTLVKKLHQEGMEIVLQFYFPKTVLQCDMLEILRYWMLEYRVDGFHIKGENIPITLLSTDPGLAGTKIMHHYFEDMTGRDETDLTQSGQLALYHDEYQKTMRCFLKGDPGLTSAVLIQMGKAYKNFGRINFFTNYYGFTMQDMVSYEIKHNEENREDNKDGANENFTWNCGVEGKTRRKKVLMLRKRQIQNAWKMLCLSQGTPMFFMGDEFCNSQGGNNNPYCQDNLVGWLNWKDSQTNQEMWQFVKKLLLFRKEHSFLRKKEPFRLMDTQRLGYPDLSYHGSNEWKPELMENSHHIGLLYGTKGKTDSFLYIAINMHWKEQVLALPKLPKGFLWKDDEGNTYLDETLEMEPRNIIILTGEMEQ